MRLTEGEKVSVAVGLAVSVALPVGEGDSDSDVEGVPAGVGVTLHVCEWVAATVDVSEALAATEVEGDSEGDGGVHRPRMHVLPPGEQRVPSGLFTRIEALRVALHTRQLCCRSGANWRRSGL